MTNNLSLLSRCKGHTSITWNCRSLLPKIEEIVRMVKTASPEFIFLTETWLDENIDNTEIAIDSYNLCRFDRTLNSGKRSGGGLAIYYKDKLKCVPLPEFDTCNPHIEITWLKLKLVNTRSIYYGVVYRPPTGNIQNFFECIDAQLNVFNNFGLCEVNISGDMNLNLYQRNA